MCYSAIIEKDLATLSKNFSATLDLDAYLELEKTASCSSKPYKTADSFARIYPAYFAPIVRKKNNSNVISPMRYSAYPPSYFSAKKAQTLTTYNARYESLLTRFWSESFGHHHGIIVIREFFEWLTVRDLIADNKISLTAIKEHFALQKQKRREKWLAGGRSLKSFRETVTEKKNPEERNIIVSFRPDPQQLLLVPVVYSKSQKDSTRGFAIITEQATKSILQAGHERMPFCISPDYVDQWLHPKSWSLTDIHKSLRACCSSVRFQYSLEFIRELG